MVLSVSTARKFTLSNEYKALLAVMCAVQLAFMGAYVGKDCPHLL